MPVLSPRRSSTSTSGSYYGTTSSATGGPSSSSGGSYSSAASYLNRASSLSKTTSPSSSAYSPSYGSYLSSYSTYSPRSTAGRSSSSSWYLSGGSAGLSTYRTPSSYLGAGSHDTTTSSRYGLVKKPRASETLKKKKDDNNNNDNGNDAKKPPSGSEANKRLSGSYSSSSLARLVATSGLDIYEKYSPAHYKPNCELSRSRSALTEAEVASASASDAANASAASSAATAATRADDTYSRNDITTNVTLDRPRRSRYSHLYSGDSDTKNDETEGGDSSRAHRSSGYRGSAAKLANSSSATSMLSNSSSCGDVPTATFTLRSNRLSKATRARDDDDATLKNGVTDHGSSGGIGGDSCEALGRAQSQLKELKLSSSGSMLHADGKSGNAITNSSSSNNIGSNNNKDSSSGVDVGDRGVVNANASTMVSNNGDVSASATLKLADTTMSAKKQKCDPVVLVQSSSSKVAAVPVAATPTPTPIPTQATPAAASAAIASPPASNASTTTAKLLHDPRVRATGSSVHGVSSTTPTNPVRAANQRFFLHPAFKDQNFLKEECEVAHAQVASPTHRQSHSRQQQHQHQHQANHQSQQSKREKKGSAAVSGNASASAEQGNAPAASRGEDKRNNNFNSNNNHVNSSSRNGNSNNNTFSNRHGHSNSHSHSSSIGYQLPRSATAAAAAAVTTNGMRRSGGANGSHHPPPAAGDNSNHSTTAVHNNKADQSPKILSRIPKQPVGALSSAAKLNARQVKPLVHRSIISSTAATAAHAATAPTSASAPATAAATAIATANKLNNNSIGIGGNNNSMQHSLDHDDIKYIDSDEPTTQLHCCAPSQPQHSAAKGRTRPKSTIVCTPNSFVFEKVNNYKYANGSSSASAVADAVAARRHELRHSGIDSNSIKASIEKFNSFSEQKRAVTFRSHGASGSTSNLQHNRHSTEFSAVDSSATTSGGGSLTRKASAGLHANPAAAISPFSSVRTVLSSSGSSTNSLPSKSSVSGNCPHDVALLRTAERASASSLLVGKDAPASAYGKQHQQDPCAVGVNANGSGDAKKHATATVVDGLRVAEDSIRSTALRSIPPPPPSPTASRYWDRDSSRTSSSALLSSSAANNANEATRSSSSDEKRSEGLCGLRNIGNTCFMNSVIQCLSHTSELTKFLRTHNGIRSTSSKDQLILYEFAKLIREMWTSNVHSVTPLELKRAFSTKHRMYSDYNQQDAQEFLRFFLDSLHSALNTGVKGEPLRIDDNLSDNKKAELTWEWYTRHENSLIRDLFVGQLKSTLRCTTCGNTSVTFDPFWDLSVPLPSSSRCKLDACLELFIREEVLDGDEMPTCSKCRTRRRCTKSFTIQRFPKYLVIHLKRFSETRWSKMSNIVEFPTGERELNMGPYGSNPNTSMYYSLYAISNHMGSTAGGHYVALCKHPASKKWHEFNDNIVSEALSENHLVSSSAYILFYERA